MEKYLKGLPIVYNNYDGDVAVVYQATDKLILLEENEELNVFNKDGVSLSISNSFKYKFLGFTGGSLRAQDLLLPLGLMFSNSSGSIEEGMRMLIRKVKTMTSIKKAISIDLRYKVFKEEKGFTLRIYHPEISWLDIVDDFYFTDRKELNACIAKFKFVLRDEDLADAVRTIRVNK